MPSSDVQYNHQQPLINQQDLEQFQQAPQHVSTYSALALALPEDERQRLADNFERNRPNGELVYVVIPYQPYIHPRNAHFNPHQVFFMGTNGVAVWLKDALLKDYTGIANGDLASLPEDVSSKVSLRIHFQGCRPYMRQINARRFTSHGETITVKTLARKIAQEVSKCMEATRNQGAPLQHGGVQVQFDNLFLHRLYRVSHGSWEVELGALLWV